MKLLNTKRLEDKCPRSSSSRYRDIKYRGFPPPIKIGGSNFWDDESVDQWLLQQAAIPYNPQPVAVPRQGKRRGRPSKCKVM